MEDYRELFDEIISLAWRNFIRKSDIKIGMD